jgi:aspartate-semialdehyde dehydrogenase
MSSLEMEFLKADIPVFSNAKNYRRDSIVPLVVPTVNLSISISFHTKESTLD